MFNSTFELQKMYRHILVFTYLLLVLGFAVATPIAQPDPQLDNALAGLPILGDVLSPIVGGTAAAPADAAAAPPS